MATELTFVDTNVLVYAHDGSELEKQPLARAALDELWNDRAGLLSTQVLQEFYVVATGRQRIAIAPAAAREIVAVYSAWPVVTLDPTIILNAARLHEERAVSFWDALIVVAAQVAGATRLLTEDLQHGEVFDGLRIENLFAA